MNFTSIFLGFITGLIGLAYFIYGKKISSFTFIIAGVLLMFYTYFISNMIVLILVGIVLFAMPFVL